MGRSQALDRGTSFRAQRRRSFADRHRDLDRLRARLRAVAAPIRHLTADPVGVGMTIMWFLAPAEARTRFPFAPPVPNRCRRRSTTIDEPSAFTRGSSQRSTASLSPVTPCARLCSACLHHHLGEPHRHRRVALRGLSTNVLQGRSPARLHIGIMAGKLNG